MGKHFWIDEVGLIITQLDGSLTGQATIRFGITGTPQKYLANVLTTQCGALLSRQMYDTLLADVGESTLVAGVSIGGVLNLATKYKGKFYFKGFTQ